ncbi:MAG: DUF1566 domain-containing protein [Campylobacterota bacterium]|nr:DUF1566 domain-containing protein [Campylobacterota bacterium]
MKFIGFLLFTCNLLLATPFVIDNKTALMWQDIPENKGVIFTWEEAKEYCEELDIANYDDWWLPSEEELSTLVDSNRPQGRKILKGFIYYKAKEYWTSSTYSWNAPYAWVISFANGTSYSLLKKKQRFVRCVRCSDFKECLEKFYF